MPDKKKILLLGPAGAGKGTQAAKIIEEYGFEHISTGDLIRAAIKSGSELGEKVKSIVEAGKLVSDDIVNKIVQEKISKLDAYILDGYPRTLGQAEFLDSYTQLDLVFNFSVPRDELVKRLTGRRMCTKTNKADCKATFHLLYSPPKEENTCDFCASELMQRKDDMPDVIENRLNSYDSETGNPLTEYYTKQKILINLNANRAPEEVYSELKKHLCADFVAA